MAECSRRTKRLYNCLQGMAFERLRTTSWKFGAFMDSASMALKFAGEQSWPKFDKEYANMMKFYREEVRDKDFTSYPWSNINAWMMGVIGQVNRVKPIAAAQTKEQVQQYVKQRDAAEAAVIADQKVDKPQSEYDIYSRAASQAWEDVKEGDPFESYKRQGFTPAGLVRTGVYAVTGKEEHLIGSGKIREEGDCDFLDFKCHLEKLKKILIIGGIGVLALVILLVVVNIYL